MISARYCLAVCLLFATMYVKLSQQYDDELFYEKFINYLYGIYPDFEQRLFEYNGTDFGVNTSVKFQHISKAYAMQARTEGGYSVFLSTMKRKSFLEDGTTKMSDRPHSVLYKCKSGKCSFWVYFHSGTVTRGVRFHSPILHTGSTN